MVGAGAIFQAAPQALDFIQFNLSIQAAITHTETGKALRVYLGGTIFNGVSTDLIALTVGRFVGIQRPEGWLFAEVLAGANYIQFYV